MDNMEGLHQQKINHFRSLISQILAALSSAVIMFNLSQTNAVMSVVNSKLDEKNSRESFFMTKDQTSWYSSLHSLMHIAGSLLAGYLQDSFGRKRTMMLSSLPQAIGCYLLYLSSSPTHLYFSSTLLGIGAALGEVPVTTYISETASSKFRGRLFFFTKFGYGLGASFLFSFENYLNWRTLALISAACPLLAIFHLLLIPETPSWLLSKGRSQDALESLSWLRGWAPAVLVTEEFSKLQQYIKDSKAVGKSKDEYFPVPTKLEEEELPGKSKMWQGFKILLTREFLQPYKIVTATFFLSYILSLKTVKPYLMMVLKRFEKDIEPSRILALSSAVQIFGAITMLMTINTIGKRKLIFWTFAGSSICLALFGLYSFLYTSYGFHQGWILYAIFIAIYYFTGYAIGGMPWYICSELYPQKIRGMASGISATTGYLMIFVLVKIYFKLEASFGVPYLYLFYALIGGLGTIYLYVALPETENKTLEEIEKGFRKKNNPIVKEENELIST